MAIDFYQLFHTQKLFDERLEVNNKVDKLKKNFMALLVETAESANERPQIFKYWSREPKASAAKTAEFYAKKYNERVIPIEKDLLLEELADVLHVMMSIGNELEINPNSIDVVRSTADNELDLYLDFVTKVVHLFSLWNYLNRHKSSLNIHSVSTEVIPISFQDMINSYFTLIHALGYTEEEIEKAYYEKNKINHQRQENGY